MQFADSLSPSKGNKLLSALRKIPEEYRSHSYCDGSLKSSFITVNYTYNTVKSLFLLFETRSKIYYMCFTDYEINQVFQFVY